MHEEIHMLKSGLNVLTNGFAGFPRLCEKCTCKIAPIIMNLANCRQTAL